MPKICCCSEQFEEIKKKVQKIKKFMGETFQNLRAQGKGVVVERQEDIVIEGSERNFIKRTHTITREKFRKDANIVPNATIPKVRQPDRTKQQNIKSNNSRQQKDIIETPIFLGKTIETPLKRSKRSQVSLELAVLKQEIDDEIGKLKAIRNFTLQHSVNDDKIPKTNMEKQQHQKSSLRNDRTWAQNFTANSPTTIKYTFEKYSSEHRLKASASAKIHNQHNRDEQTSCRPRMRTIGLQKNTQRSASVSNKKKHTVFQDSALNLKFDSIAAAAMPVTATTYCFDYVPTPDCNIGDYCNRSQQQCCNNESIGNNCEKYCQRVSCNSKNHNGLICNQNIYSEKGKTPCTEYKYCCDEIYYNYSPGAVAPVPAVVCCKQPTCNATTCCRHHHSSSNKCGVQSPPLVNYHRCNSDLCTDEFHHKTAKCDDDRRHSISRSPTKDKQLATRQREQEKVKAAQERKKRAARREDKKLLSTTSEEEHAAKIAELLLMGEKSKRQSRLTKKEICRLRKLLASSTDDGECDKLSDEDIDENTKRVMEKMRVKDYRPARPKTENVTVEKEHEMRDFLDAEIAKLDTSDKSLDKKEKQYEKYIGQYDAKPEAESADLIQQASSTVEEQDSQQQKAKGQRTDDDSPARNANESKTYTRLTATSEQQTDITNSDLRLLGPSDSRRSFLINRKYSYPEEVVKGKTIPRYDPKEEAEKTFTSKEADIVEDKTMMQVVSHIPPNGDLSNTEASIKIEETSSTLQDLSDIRKLDVKQMVQPADTKGFPDVSSHLPPPPKYYEKINEKGMVYRADNDDACATTRRYLEGKRQQPKNVGSEQGKMSRLIKRPDPSPPPEPCACLCGNANKISSPTNNYAVQQTHRSQSQNSYIQCPVPEFSGCPCMFETYLNLLAYLEVGKEKSKDFCSNYGRAKSQT